MPKPRGGEGFRGGGQGGGGGPHQFFRAVSRASSASMMFMWSRIERSARSFSPMVLRRIMRIWVNRFSARSMSTPLWLIRMMV